MKINIFEDPMNGSEDKLGEIETDKKSDKDAEILEALEHLRAVCKKYDVTIFARVLLNEAAFYGAQTVPTENSKAQKDYHFLVANISEWIEKTTSGQLKVIRTEK